MCVCVIAAIQGDRDAVSRMQGEGGYIREYGESSLGSARFVVHDDDDDDDTTREIAPRRGTASTPLGFARSADDGTDEWPSGSSWVPRRSWPDSTRETMARMHEARRTRQHEPARRNGFDGAQREREGPDGA